ncbi:acyl-CoA dehydrogenase family protein [Cryptosporangium sp. NPDC051539]|uniref:acyl-CoA dehydrogenase family protein n=1 Tax=Cryptosporangium sp. NPDC051539 TaxID=3363962 RepID=UPI0037A1C92A
MTAGPLTAPPAVERVADRASARRFVDARVAPIADQYDRAGRVPDTLLHDVGQAGLWAPFVPVELGGAGLPLSALGPLHEEVGRGCSSLRSLLTVQSMVAYAILRWGDTAQREHWLPQLATGRTPASLCVSEAGAGSDAQGLTTGAVRRAGGWVLNGTKTWITGGQRARLFLVFAKADERSECFLVPSTAPGVEVRPIEDMLGTRAGMLATVSLRDALVDDDARIGPVPFAPGMMLTGTLDIGRFSVAAGCVGILAACVEACRDYTRARHVGGVPLRELQLIRAKLSNMVTDLSAARLLCERAGGLKDAGSPETIMATWIAKYFASVAAARHASEAVQIHGAHGCGPGSPVSRLYRDAKVMEIIEGSSEIQQITIADAAYRTQERS